MSNCNKKYSEDLRKCPKCDENVIPQLEIQYLKKVIAWNVHILMGVFNI